MLALALTLGLTTATAGPGVKVKRVHAPPVVLRGVRSLQVRDFKGPYGSQVASGLRQALQDPDRSTGGSGGVVGGLLEVGGAVAGEAVGGSAGQLVRQVGSAAGSVADEGGRVHIADDGLKVDVFRIESSGADAAISGQIQVSDKVESYKAKQKKRNAKGQVVKNKDGKPIYITVSCKRRTVTTSIQWKVDSADGSLLTEKTIQRKLKDNRCGDDIGNLKSKDELGRASVRGVGPQIANTIAPSWGVDRLSYDRSKTIKEPIRLARQGEVAEAACAARAIAKADPYATEPKLALGVYMEALGYVQEAGTLYSSAAAVNGDKLARKRADSLRTRMAEVETLTAAYGLTYAFGETQYGWCPELPDGRPVVSKRSTALWTSRELDASTKVSSIPKGMKLFVVEETGSAFKVATLDGQEGWVPAKHVK